MPDGRHPEAAFRPWCDPGGFVDDIRRANEHCEPPGSGPARSSAVITVDLDHLHPVFDGRWHRVVLDRLPGPDEIITTLCGQRRPVRYGTPADRLPAARTCWPCDLAFRRANGIAVPPNHPALATP